MNVFEHFVQAESQEELAELIETFNREGYPAFHKFQSQFREYFKSFYDDQAVEAQALIAKAKRTLPNPGAISPSWTYIWDDFEALVDYKLKVLATVPHDARDGEWQILIDNPYTNREVACYPGLTFLDAAYIYAKFRPELENNEYIRLQKIQTHVTEFGQQ
jgi:hypothetical protein